MARFTEAQWQRLLALLDRQEARAQRQLTALRADTKPVVREAPIEYAELADQEASDLTNDVMLAHYRGELDQIDAARERMHEHRYGICINCGELIPFLRLQAQPTALRCLTCEGVHERKRA
ncbi:TraR/DksA family transcriptional regulator [Ralstonia pseudosolanacearum]|uniref:TraR/DksA family transcriptional regulator n=1 Tax=Ralstonia pseudosolanacearum TaxID=1310165 RepID=UPI0018D1951D|nr:TraR/DksA family transcriptional regulator [Ralstonia pseudosolanacearum]